MKKNILLCMALCIGQIYGMETEGTKLSEQSPGQQNVQKITRNAEQMHDVLNNIIKSTDSFMVKAQTLPELERKVKSWGTRGLLIGWEPSFDWNKVKKDIQLFRQLAQKLIEKDPKNNTYKYLQDFIQQESLIVSMEKLKAILFEYEQKLETSSFEMSEPVKKAMTTIMSAYIEVLYQKKIIDELNKILEKYEPRAKELREEKEKAESLAQEAKQISQYSATGNDMVIAGGGSSESDSSNYSYKSDYSSDYTGGLSYEPSYESSYDLLSY